ncbi:MAG: polyprenyl synthetase family protein [Xylanivirga thermophila]|jgi:geranylgeranyl diphosphate synthase, type II|uniref:polyprenyl synthetase family protein n=1 Tax=Xylanivirga thermophila TaxID=2496273 RepID=UPI00101D73B0|nr:farnesyl diphosphate synthase [Xylanivirga thermophila]
MTFKEQYSKKLNMVNNKINLFIEADAHYSDILIDAMKYSLNAGGKRLRPILLLSAHELLDGNLDESLPIACALEMIHTYSLIHDDLPAMDNDDFRRGKPTNHRIYGEAVAILAGDALLNRSYEIMIQNSIAYQMKLPYHTAAIQIIAKAAGMHGMIGGQVADIEYQANDLDDDAIRYIHTHKTGALITASLMAGAILENPNQTTLNSIKTYGEKLGLAFQITDDILDVVGDLRLIGKQPGSDLVQQKLTYPKIYGLENSQKMAKNLVDEAISYLDIFGSKADFLKDIANHMLERQC